MHGNPDLKVPDNTDGIYIYIYVCVKGSHGQYRMAATYLASVYRQISRNIEFISNQWKYVLPSAASTYVSTLCISMFQLPNHNLHRGAGQCLGGRQTSVWSRAVLTAFQHCAVDRREHGRALSTGAQHCPVAGGYAAALACHRGRPAATMAAARYTPS